MTNVAALPALALIVGAAAGVYVPLPLAAFVACAAIGWLALTFALMAPVAAAGEGSHGGIAGWIAHLASIASIAGFFGAGAALAAHATRAALTPPILADSHALRVDVAGAGGAVPVVLSGVIRTDASATEFGAMFTLAADGIRVEGGARETAGIVRIAVGGTSAAQRIGEWRAGRRVRVTAALAAPLPYLNIGTPNQETRLALAGIRLFGSVKGAAQVELLARGRWWDEAAASARAFVRRAVADHVGRRASQRREAAASLAGAADLAGVAIATAILIGDRAGLNQDVEERLQRAGTFHVIAISGGNIAILTALILGLLRLAGLSPRTCAWLTISAVGIYAFIVGSGASVARAALAAIVYLFARAIDHRTPAINALAVVAAIMLVWAPLEIVDAGFWLTCLATLAIMLLAQRLADRARSALHRIANGSLEEPRDSDSRSTLNSGLLALSARTARMLAAANAPLTTTLTNRVVEPAIGLLAATVAAEAVLLPVTAYAFSQVSIAGLVLNFLAIPLMTVVQVAGIAIVLCAGVHELAPIADFAGIIADLAARGIVSTSHIVDAAPWSAPRVAPPPLWLLLACQLSLCLAWFGRPPPWRRRIAACAWLTCLGLVVWALPLPSFALHAVGSEECQMADSDGDSGRDLDGDLDSDPQRDADRGQPRRLRVTFLDVAQGDATLIRFPDGRAWLVDTGGALGRFDIGTRIVSPALWALGLRRLSTLVLTHGDRDHIGGAHAMLRDFRPAEVWEGVPVEGHAQMTRLKDEAIQHHARWRIVQSGARVKRIGHEEEEGDDGNDDGGHEDDVDAVDIRVWHPSVSEWKRTRVRNDDSIVLELALRNVSLVLPGDIGPAVERVLAVQQGGEDGRPAPVSAPTPNFRTASYASDVPLPSVSAPLRVLKVPHHGSKTSSTAPFLDALQPRLAIVSAGRGNRHGHPAPAALARYAARGTEVFRTDQDGAIQLDTDGHTVTVRTCSGRRLTLRADGQN